MISSGMFSFLVPFTIAFAMTHLIVLPLKAFFITGDLHHTAVRAATWNLLALVYTATIVFISGVEAQSGTWGIMKFSPTIVIFAVSIGVWIYVMFRAPRKMMMIDLAVFTILAFAAS